MSRHGFLMPLALMIAIFFGIVGGAFLYSQSILYRGAVGANLQLQARTLAEVGVQDARCKLQRDIDFPPAGSEEQTEYAYTETYLDPITQAPAGSYTVVLDQTYAEAPYFVVIVRSTGSALNAGTSVIKSVVAELDVSPKDRKDASKDNEHYLQVLNWREQ